MDDVRLDSVRFAATIVQISSIDNRSHRAISCAADHMAASNRMLVRRPETTTLRRWSELKTETGVASEWLEA